MRSILLVAIALFALAASGCGGGGSSAGKNEKAASDANKPIAKVIDQLVSASHAGDTGKICTQLFTPGLAKAVAAKGKTTCDAAVKKSLANPKEDITVTKIQNRGTIALVTVREQNSNVTNLSLVKQNDAWRINAIQ